MVRSVATAIKQFIDHNGFSSDEWGDAITRQKRKYKNMNQRLHDLGILYEGGNIRPIDNSVSNELGLGQ